MAEIQDRLIDGTPIRVIDDAFDPGLVGMIHAIAADLPMTRSEAATADDLEARQLKHEFDHARMAANPALGALLKRTVAEVDAFFGAGAYRLFRAHTNDQTYGDFQHAHPDVKSGVTALYFANPEWREDWHGETLLYDLKGEPVSAVAVRPGRLVLFPGWMIHRGGMPSRLCLRARLTIAFKFERNEQGGAAGVDRSPSRGSL